MGQSLKNYHKQIHSISLTILLLLVKNQFVGNGEVGVRISLNWMVRNQFMESQELVLLCQQVFQLTETLAFLLNWVLQNTSVIFILKRLAFFVFVFCAMTIKMFVVMQIL